MRMVIKLNGKNSFRFTNRTSKISSFYHC